MMKLFDFLTGAALAQVAYATSRTIAPSGALTVGSGETYSTIQDAVDALDSSTSDEQSIFIKPSTYDEQVLVSALKGPLTIYGYTEDTSSYNDNQVTITSSHALADESTDDETGTLRVETTNFKMYNINVKNTWGNQGSDSQALAVSANAEVKSFCPDSSRSANDFAESGILWMYVVYDYGAVTRLSLHRDPVPLLYSGLSPMVEDRNAMQCSRNTCDWYLLPQTGQIFSILLSVAKDTVLIIDVQAASTDIKTQF